jgi:hypothetical protein
MAVRGTNTMQEALQRLLTDVAQMKTLGDSDLPWLVELESMVLTKIKAPVEAMQQQGGPLAQPGGAPQSHQMPDGSTMAGPPMGPPPGPQGMPAGAPMGGMNAGASAPNADELQRLLSAGGPGGLGA